MHSGMLQASLPLLLFLLHPGGWHSLTALAGGRASLGGCGVQALGLQGSTKGALATSSGGGTGWRRAVGSQVEVLYKGNVTFVITGE